MNHIYKVVFCKTTGTFVAVAEYARAHGKKGSGSVGSTSSAAKSVAKTGKYLMFSAVSSAMLMLSGNVLAANPTGTTTSATPTAGTTNTQITGANICYFDTGTSSVVCGNDKTTTGVPTNTAPNSVAIGTGTVASSANDVFIGNAAGVGFNPKGNNTPITASNYIVTNAGGNNPVITRVDGATVTAAELANLTVTGIGTGAVQALQNNSLPSPAQNANNNNIGIGNNVGLNSTGTNNVIMGNGAAKNMYGTDTISIGTNANNLNTGSNQMTAAWQSVAIGANTQTAAQGAVAIGNNAKVTIGTNTALATNSNSGIAIGNSALAQGYNTVSMGAGSKSLSPGSIAIGTGAYAFSDNGGGGPSIAIGESTNAQQHSIAIDSSSAWGHSTAIGGASAGTALLADGVTHRPGAGESTAIGFRADAEDQGLSLGNYSQSSGTQSAAVGMSAKALVYGAFAGGVASNVDATSTQGIAIGSFSKVINSPNSVSLGNTALVNSKSNNSIAIGNTATVGSSTAGALNAIAMGNGAQALGNQAISIGTGNQVKGNNSGAIGDPSYINTDNSYGIGNNNTINSQKSFILGNGVTIASGFDGAVVLGDSSTVKAATPTSTASVNGVNYTFAGGIAPATGGVVSVGSNGAERQIQNVAAGQINNTSTDAINGSQLYAVANQVGNNTAQVGNTYFHVGTSANTGTGNATTNLGSITDAAGASMGSVTSGVNAVAPGSYSVVIGQDAGTGSNTTTGENVVIGNSSGRNNTITAGDPTNSTQNTAIGTQSGNNITGKQNTALGGLSGNNITGVNNTAVGYYAGHDVTGNKNAALGYSTGYNVNGAFNTAVGAENGANVTGQNNVGIGYQSGNNLSGQNNIAIGRQAGGTNTQNTLGGISDISNTIAIGNVARTNGTQSIAIGGTSTANKSDDIAFGNNSTATGGTYTTTNANDTSENGLQQPALAIGKTAQATGAGTAAMGLNAIATGSGATAVGKSANATSDHSTYIGDESGKNTTAGSNTNSLGVGYHAGMATNGVNNTMIGSDQAGANMGTSTYATTVGYMTGVNSQGNDNTAIGNMSGQKTLGDSNTAVGDAAGQYVTGKYNTAMGYQSGFGGNSTTQANVSQSVAIGNKSQAKSNSSVAIGDNASVATNSPSSVAIGLNAKGNNSSTTAMGSNSTASGSASSAVGAGSTASGNYSSAFGTSTYATGDNSVAVGNASWATKDSAVAVGNVSYVMGQKSIGVGNGNYITGDSSGSIGNANNIAQTNTFVMGNSVRTTQANSVVLGNASTDRPATTETTGTINGVTYGNFAGPGSTANGVVSVGAVGKERQIINVAAGKIASDSTDAINGSQLYLVAKGTLSQLPVVYTDAAGNKVEKSPNGNFYPAGTPLDAAGNPTNGVAPVSNVIASMNNPNNTTNTPTTLANVAGNLPNTYNNDAYNTTNQPVTTAQALPTKADGTPALNVNNAATVGDVLNSGWNLQGNGAAKDFVKAYDTVNFVNGAGTTATVTTAADGKSSTVQYDVSVDGTTIKTVNQKDANGNDIIDANGKPLTQITANTTTLVPSTTTPGQITAGDTKSLATAGDIANAINSSGFNVVADKTGTGTNSTTPASQLIHPSEKVTFTAGNGVDIAQNAGNFTFAVNAQNVANNAQLPVVYTDNAGNKVYLVNGAFNTAADGSGSTVPNSKVIASMQNADGSTTNQTKLTNVAPATLNSTSTDAVNGSQLYTTNRNVSGNTAALGGGAAFDPTTNTYTAPSYITTKTDGTTVTAHNVGDALTNLNNEVIKPITFAGDSGTPFTRKLGEQTNVKGGATGSLSTGNVGVVADGTDTLNVQLAKELTGLTSAQFTDPTTGTVTNVNGNGMTIKPTTGSPVSLTTNGLDNGNNQIHNVAAGTSDTDGVNVSQLNAVAANAKTTSVVKGTNVASITSNVVGNNTEYTINANGAKTSAGSNAVTVTPTDAGNNVTDYAVDLSQASKDSLAKADSALQTVVTQIDGNPVKTINQTNNTANFITGDNMVLSADGNGGIKVATAKDVNFNSVTAGNVTTSGLTVNPNSTINMGGNVIGNVASGLQGKTLDQIKTEGNTSPQWNNAANIGDLAQVQSNVTNVQQIVGGTDINGNVTDGNGNQVTYIDGTRPNETASEMLRTYDAAGPGTVETNSVVTAIKNINEQGTKYIHFNGGERSVGGLRGSNDEQSQANGLMSTAIGYKTDANGDASVAIGNASQANGNQSIAIGDKAIASGEQSISIGAGNQVSGNHSGAIGDPNTVSGNASYAFGNDNTVAADNSFALANNAQVTQNATGATALGNKTTVTAAGGVALGENSVANRAGLGATVTTSTTTADPTQNQVYALPQSTTADKNAIISTAQNSAGAVSVGTDGVNRQITHVAAGSLDDDAVNVAQLKAAANTAAAAAVAAKTTLSNGKNTTVNPTLNTDGSTNYTVDVNTDNTTITTTAGKLTAVTAPITSTGGIANTAGNSQLATAGDVVNAVNNSGFNLTAQGANASLVKPGSTVNMKNTDGNIVVSKSATDNNVNYDLAKNIKVDSLAVNNSNVALNNAGLNNGGNTITNVKAGVADTDAVNVGQLNTLGYNVNHTLNKLGDRIDGVRDDANAGISGAMAMAALPQAYLPGKSMLSGGMATYNGEGAVAIGVSKLSDNGRWVIKVNGTADTKGNAGAAVGAGFHW